MEPSRSSDHRLLPTAVRKVLTACVLFAPWGVGPAQAYLDNETLYSNQDPANETRRSEHFRINFGHYNRDTGTPVTEELVQGNLRMFEQMWNRWVVEMGMHDLNESATNPDGNKYRANFNLLMTWDDGGGGGAYSSMDAGGFGYAMANPAYCRFDPPSGATPHEFGHAWQITAGGFNGTTSSGSWWEGHANWMQLQFLNSYPQAGEYLRNGMYYPSHGRDYYESFMIWEEARENPAYGAAWVNEVWTNASAEQRVDEYIIERMVRLDASGSPDQAGAVGDLWGNMARKLVTWDYERQRWLATVNRPDDGSDWAFYQRCRTPLVRMPGAAAWYRPSRDHLPMQYGFNIIPLEAAAGAAVTCDFRPQCDPVRQSDWRACLVAVNTAGGASYSSLWNTGPNSITLSADQDRLYLVVIATPKPMPIADPVWDACRTDAGLQFPYAVSFTNAGPRNVIYPPRSRVGMHRHANGGGWVSDTATVEAGAYVGPDAQVLDSAVVRNNARIEDYAVVRHNAQVRDHAVVSGHGMVRDQAQVYGRAKVRDWARVFGHAEVYENAKVIEHGNCGDGDAATHTKVYGNAIVKGTTYVYNPSTFNGGLIMEGDSANGNGTTPSSHGVHFGWGWGQDTGRFNGLADNGFVYARHSFEKDNAVFAMDEFGINHGFLMNGCRVAVDEAAPVRGGRVLPLDGASQYVELHNTVNDFTDSTYAVWFKWAGGASGQAIWSMGDGAGKVMSLTPRDGVTGGLRFVISDGTSTQALDGPAIAAGTWIHVAVVFSGSSATLYLDGAAVAGHPAMALFPGSLNAPLMENANFLGRGHGGDHFHGSLDDFRVYMKGLDAGEVAALHAEAAPATVAIPSDAGAPTPDAATWLVEPRAVDDTTVTMSATPGTDAAGWVEYYFTCTSGGGNDSGWVSFHKYTDANLAPGSSAAYTVRMRDRAGNTTAESPPATVSGTPSTAGTASFAAGPVGIANGRITMTATEVSHASGMAEYRFDCTGPLVASSGWQSSPSWTHTGLTSGASYSYTVTVRDGRGNTSSPSAPSPALAKDDAAPALPALQAAHWEMLPYATIDNRISMTATAAEDSGGVRYYFHCVSGGGPDSGWQSSRTFRTPVLADGTYVYDYKVRDVSAGANESGWSVSYAATITPATGYHARTLAEVLAGEDDDLVAFPATVMRVNADHYVVKDLATGDAIPVRPDTYGLATDPAVVLKNVIVKGHLYTLGGERVVTYASLAVTGNPPLSTISGTVREAGGGPVPGAIVYFSDSPDPEAHPIATATCDGSGSFSRDLPVGTWHVAAGSSMHNTSASEVVTLAGSPVSGIDFSLGLNSGVAGTVTRRSDGTPVAGAAVYFSRTPGASASPVHTAITDGDGNYDRAVQDGIWHVAVAASGFYTALDKTVEVDGSDLGGIDFALEARLASFPRESELLFAALAESHPPSGLTGPWAAYWPTGQSLDPIQSPSAEMAGGGKWERNVYGEGDGYRFGSYDAPIPVNGATIVVAVRPERNAISTSWTSVVDIFYQRLVLGVRNNTGRIEVWRNGAHSIGSTGTAIPDGEATILSLVVQPDGRYKVHANGIQVMSVTTTSDMSSLVPGVNGAYAKYINVGRNDPDGWTTFNGNIGDVFVYKVALSDAERQQVEADLSFKFLATDPVISASAGEGGTINPVGAVPVAPGGGQTFTIAASAGHVVSGVTVNGVPQGALGSYTFSDVTADQSISATFAAGSNTAPSISTMADQSIVAGTSTGALPFTVDDAETPAGELLVTATSSNLPLVSQGGIVLGGDGANRTVTVTPVPGAGGATTITLTVSDGLAEGSSSFLLAVAPGSGNPTISVTFNANRSLDPGEVTGAEVAVGHWNNLTVTGGNQNGTWSALSDSEGSATGTSLTTAGWNTIVSMSTDGNPFTRLYEAGVAREGGVPAGSATISLHDIPYAVYDVYVYYTHFPIGSDTLQAWTESQMGTTLYGTNNRNHGHDWGGFAPYQSSDRATAVAQATSGGDGGGNWLKFTGLTGSTLTLTSSDANAPEITGFKQRAVAGIQIVSAGDDPFTTWRKLRFGDAWDNDAVAGPEADPDGDGKPNFFEFGLNGDPLDGSDCGLWVAELGDSADGDLDPELLLTCAVRRGAVFAGNGDHAQESAPIDGLIYTIEGSSTLVETWNSPVGLAGVSEAAPAGSGLPDLTGTPWQYHRFSGFNGLPDRGFLRIKVTVP